MPTIQKQNGVHFTPADLAAVVAERIAPHVEAMRGNVRILDPACGDGNLLVAIANALSRPTLRRSTLIGVEDDETSFRAVNRRMEAVPDCAKDLVRGDFLDLVDEQSLFSSASQMPPVDAIIANPPYVRTQVLGAARAQDLAARFDLRGRVDLYQAFLVGMSRQLRPGGVLGVITSNRFLTTRGGASVRQLLRSRFEILEIVDLGDTKLFEAAVLPALVFAKRRRADSETSTNNRTKFVRIYEDAGDDAKSKKRATSILDMVRQPKTGTFAVNDIAYQVASGSLNMDRDDSKPWCLLTTRENEWVETIRSNAECLLGDVARIRVGIKTTADAVFIRSDWDSLAENMRPESRFLKPVLSHDDAAKWLRRPESTASARQVLYTHEVARGKRRAIRFDKQSKAWKYLVANRERLESRSYVTEAGRQWYEIWVPQDPDAWHAPKIVFPDISPESRFFLDRGGSVVDGNCYWITTRDPADDDLLLLVLGVANSSVIARFHELAFPNKLYSQRRRYLTQYVSEYPVPPRSTPAARQIVRLVKTLTRDDCSPAKAVDLQSEIDRQVAAAFDMNAAD